MLDREPIRQNNTSPEDLYDDLLKNTPANILPEELRKNFDAEFAEVETDEDIHKLIKKIKAIIEHRQKMNFPEFVEINEELFCKGYSEEFLEKVKHQVDEMVELARQGKLECLGEGRVGKVFLNKPNSPYCIKMILGDRRIYIRENDVKEELKLLLQLENLEVEGARTPKGYYYRGTKEMHLYVMEALPAFTLDSVLKGENVLPEGFDLEVFFDNLKNFVKKMNEEHKLYHRDLHPGNIMIDRKTGMGYIIDFGSAIFHVGNPEEAFLVPKAPGQGTNRYASDLDNIEKNKNALKRALNIK